MVAARLEDYMVISLSSGRGNSANIYNKLKQDLPFAERLAEKLLMFISKYLVRLGATI